MIELYHYDTSVCAQKVRLVLAEKGLDWTGHAVDIRGGEQFDPAYLRLNPKAVVPTLIHDGTVITESTVICEYLDDAYPTPSLRPDEATARARMRLWTKAVDEGLHAAVASLSFAIVFRDQMRALAPEELERHLANVPDPVRRERQRTAIELGLDSPAIAGALSLYDKALGELEEALSETAWAAGEAYSLADVALTPYLTRLDQLQMAGLWAARPGVADWLARIRARDGYAAITDFASDAYLANLEARGAAAWPEIERRLAA